MSARRRSPDEAREVEKDLKLAYGGDLAAVDRLPWDAKRPYWSRHFQKLERDLYAFETKLQPEVQLQLRAQALEAARAETEDHTGLRACHLCHERPHPQCGACGEYWSLALARAREIAVKLLEEKRDGARAPAIAGRARA